MSLVTTVKKAVRDRLISRAGGIDLSRLDKVPDSLSWPLQRDVMSPSARLGATRDADPVQRLVSFFGLDVWLVTGDAESREVLSDTTSYSTDIRPYMGKSGSTTDGDIGGLGFTDPPDHTRLRRLLTPEFTMRRLARLRPGIDAIIERQLAEIEAAGKISETVDLVPTFAFPIPFLVICDVLGLPDEKRETFSQLATARFDLTHGGPGSIGAIGGSREFLLAEAARQRKNPGPGLIGQIIREHGDEISDFELGGLADGVFTGGLETSASMLALGTAVLLEDRELWKRVGADPTCAGPIVDDLLRLLSVVQVAFPRFVKRDVVIGGKQIAEGSVIVCSLPAANRDPRATAGDDLDLERAHSSHLAFGHGFHRCVGAELAKMELKMAFPARRAEVPGDAVGDADRGAGLPRAQRGVRRGGRARPPVLTQAFASGSRSVASMASMQRSDRDRPVAERRHQHGVAAAPDRTCRRSPSRAESSNRSPAWDMSPPTRMTPGLTRLVTAARPHARCSPASSKTRSAATLPFLAASMMSSIPASGSCSAHHRQGGARRGVRLEAAAAATAAQGSLVVEGEVADLARHPVAAAEDLAVEDQPCPDPGGHLDEDDVVVATAQAATVLGERPEVRIVLDVYDGAERPRRCRPHVDALPGGHDRRGQDPVVADRSGQPHADRADVGPGQRRAARADRRAGRWPRRRPTSWVRLASMRSRVSPMTSPDMSPSTTARWR